MAFVKTGYTIDATIADEAGNKAKYTRRIVAADAAAASTLAGTHLAKLAAVTDGCIIGYQVSENYAFDGVKLGKDNCQVEMKATISTKIDTSGGTKEIKWATINIPAPAESIFLATTGPNSNIVNPLNAELVAFLTDYKTGIFISDGEHLETPTAVNVVGKRTHKGSHKG